MPWNRLAGSIVSSAMSNLRFLAAVAVLACSVPRIQAAEPTGNPIATASGFTMTLPDDAQAAAGLVGLSPAERTAIDELIAREVTFARQGHVTGFAGTFISRRTPEERKRAGLDRLSEAEQAKLNALVASALAAQGGRTTTGGTRLKRADMATRDRLHVHGEISFTYGWSGGGTFRGGSVYTTITDLETGISLGLGYAQYSGNGWWWDGDYYYPHYYSPAHASLRSFRDYRGSDFCVH